MAEASVDSEGALEQRCPVCLEDFDDKTFIDPCFHCFCFQCIVQWSEVTTTCPMCKTRFSTLIHNVEAIDKYTQFKVEPKLKLSGLEVSIGEARRFRYRTTRVPGQSHTQQSQQQTVGVRDEHTTLTQERRERERRERERREQARERRRAMAQQISNPASDERRRVVYSLGLWAQSPSNEGKKERVREISAAFFSQNPACTHRLVSWLTREFRVLLGSDHVQFMIQLVLSLISKINLEGDEFSEHLQPFLLTRTSHFLHELVSFAKSPFNMAAYDQRVRYDWPTTTGIRDNWDPEATVNVITEQHSPQAGPSGLSSQQIQQRLFHELTTTRWDESPPYFNPSSSPIVVHGSDSETDEPQNIVCVNSNAPSSSTVSSYTVSIANVNSSSLSTTASRVTNSSSNVESTTGSLTATVSNVTGGTAGAEEEGEHDSQGISMEEETEMQNDEQNVDDNDSHPNSCDDLVSVSVAPGMAAPETALPKMVVSDMLMDEPEQAPNTITPTTTAYLSSSHDALTSTPVTIKDRDPLTNATSSEEHSADTEHFTVRNSRMNDDKEEEEKEEEEEDECIVINAERESDVESLHSSPTSVMIKCVVVPSKPLSKGKGKAPLRQSSYQCKREHKCVSKRHYESETDKSGSKIHYETETHDRKLKDKKRKHQGRDKKHTHSSRDHGTRKSRDYHGHHSKHKRHRHHRHQSSSESDTDYESSPRRSRPRNRVKTDVDHRSNRHGVRDRHGDRDHHRDRDGDYRSNHHGDTDYKSNHHRDRDGDFDDGLDSYCVREKHHRTRLYSDDYSHRATKSSGDEKIRSHKRLKITDKGRVSSQSKQMSVVRSSKHAHVHEGTTKHEQIKDSILREELSTLDQEIVEHKREVLKAMLRSERLKLLHRQLRGEDLPADHLELHHQVGNPLRIDETTPTRKMVEQLADLDRAIVDGKRQVLRVMKKIEEETPNSDVDSS